MRLTDAEARECAAHVESCLARLDTVDEAARGVATEAVQAIVALYGEALARIVPHVPAATLTGDDVVAHVLLLHGLHPVDLQARVARAIETVRPTVSRQGAAVTLQEVGDRRVRVVVQASGCGAPSVRAAVEEAIRAAAPDLDALEIETAAPPPPLIAPESIRLRAPGPAGARAV